MRLETVLFTSFAENDVIQVLRVEALTGEDVTLVEESSDRLVELEVIWSDDCVAFCVIFDNVTFGNTVFDSVAFDSVAFDSVAFDSVAFDSSSPSPIIEFNVELDEVTFDSTASYNVELDNTVAGRDTPSVVFDNVEFVCIAEDTVELDVDVLFVV